MYQSAAYIEGYEESLARAVAALSEAIADDGKIIALLQKHWDLSRVEAEERLSHERTEGFLQRDFSRWLTQYKGMTEEEAERYVTSRVTLLAIKKIDKAWTLENGKLYERTEKEKRVTKHPARLARKPGE